MNNYPHMEATFEKNKNLKALLITLFICGLLFLLFFAMKWTLPQEPPPVVDEGIEVNLGNSETGLGDVAPQVPGDPSPTDQQQTVPPPTAKAEPQQQNITADENETADVPPIPKTEKVVTKHIATNAPKTPAKKVAPILKPTPTPPPPKPRAQMGKYTGGTGNGGNGADTYNGVTNQGIAGGNGDQGKPNGNPNSDSYTGNGGTGKSGVSIRNGLSGRKFSRYPSFEDEFNEPAKVAVDISVDATGKVTDATINPKGTTTTNPNIRAIALRKARELKLTAGADDDQGTIVFNFKLRG
ncbi:hypothetical protein ACI6Q2_18535 [Chitinophagaceae bacterium LWZ2-11]